MIDQPTFAHLIINELNRLGGSFARGTSFALAPGSRSAPLAIAMQNVKPPTLFHDERSLGFFGVGLARTGALPVLTTTSGTAVANLLPAVVEASMDGLPMVLLTADRPPEEFGRGANQTIDQRGIFGSYVVGEYALDAGTGDPTAIVDRAVQRAISDRGPVHLNVHLRKPLHITADVESDSSPRMIEKQTTETVAPGDAFDLILVGKCEPEQAHAAATLAQQIGCEIFFDVQSGNWGYGSVDFSNQMFASDPPSVSRVLVVGNRFTEHRIWSALKDADSVTQVFDWDRTFDPEGVVETRHVANLATGGRPDPTVKDDAVVDATLCHRSIVQTVQATRDRYTHVFLGNSLVIRAFDRFRSSGTAFGPTVFANRGASGIDGNLSTAAGIATSGATLAVVGDHTALHDVGALASIRSLGVDLRIVVIDNRGGRIFEHLPSPNRDLLDACFVAEPMTSIADVCRGFGLAVTELDTSAALREALSQKPHGVDVVVCRVDPTYDFEHFGSPP